MSVSRRLRYEILRRDNHTEQWRPVVGFEGLYEVADSGHVRSVRRIVIDSRGVPRTFRGRELRNTHEGNPGYVKLSLYKNGVRHLCRLHVLVAAAFLGPRPSGVYVAHNDGNPSNNRLSNLRYATPTENLADRNLHGTSNHGARNGQSRLNECAVACIRRRLDDGDYQQAIADDYEIARTTVSAIATGRSWAALATKMDANEATDGS